MSRRAAEAAEEERGSYCQIPKSHGGHRIYYQLLFPTSMARNRCEKSPKVVLIMGMGGTHAQWDITAERLRQGGCITLTLDNRGMAFSTAPVPRRRWTSKSLARDVICVLDHVGWNGLKEVHVVGHSMGSMVAQEICFLQPKRCASCTLISSWGAFSMPSLDALWTLASVFASPSTGGAISAGIRIMFPEEWLRDHSLDVEKSNFSVMQERLLERSARLPDSPLETILLQCFVCLTHDAGRSLSNVCHEELPPTHVISGAEDCLVHWSDGLKLANVLECPFTLLPKCGHWPCEQLESETTELILAQILVGEESAQRSILNGSETRSTYSGTRMRTGRMSSLL